MGIYSIITIPILNYHSLSIHILTTPSTPEIIIPTYQQTQLKADQINKQKIRFDIKQNKLFVFDKIN
ncbi:MAG: hypothetical protein Q8877_03405, partial [Sweet potato little leaf phytoplasma]|nr:hypothetical protein [Sweet potato little leaf phytoplasma]